jgi:hypothetical protein
LWTPVQKIFKWNNWELSENAEHDDDENPGTVPTAPVYIYNYNSWKQIRSRDWNLRGWLTWEFLVVGTRMHYPLEISWSGS